MGLEITTAAPVPSPPGSLMVRWLCIYDLFYV
jgi:hypothetical protein